MEKTKAPVKPKVVEAVGVSANSLSHAGRSRAKEIEAAMSAAVNQCFADGVTDPAKMKERMMSARQAVIDERTQET